MASPAPFGQRYLSDSAGGTMALHEPNAVQASFVSATAPTVTFAKAWQVVGPFQIGTREVAWGADPLEFYGGFPSLEYDAKKTFKSSLTKNGTVSWTKTSARTVEVVDANGSKVSLSIAFPNVDWTFLQAVYGWSSLQYQAWARGEINVQSDQPVTASLYASRILEYAVDGERHFGGDFYDFQRAPHSLTLKPGKHVLDVRIYRDVRAMGGIGAPTVDVAIALEPALAQVEIGKGKVLVSDVVDGVLPSPYGTVSVRNNGQDWIDITQISDLDPDNEVTVSLLGNAITSIAPGQTRAVQFLVKGPGTKSKLRESLAVAIEYRKQSKAADRSTMTFTLPLTSRSKYQPHKVTHLHPGGIVSYHILRPPAANASCPKVGNSTAPAPVLLSFHGAGLEADGAAVSQALQPLPQLCAWVIFPTGVTPWSGDDWHNWGFADVRAAVDNLQDYLDNTGWKGIPPDTGKWLVSGHSNGGQGSWYTLFHHPDNVVAAAPVSGYLSIPEYVPYKFWRPTEAKKKGVIDAVLNSFRHELLVRNAFGIPIQQQHGEKDDNVPAYHSRLIGQLLVESGWESNYYEAPEKGHYWDTVLTTETLSKFYDTYLNKPLGPKKTPDRFEIVVANPGDMGSMHGIRVLALVDPAELGKVYASAPPSNTSSERTFRLTTHNIMAFALIRPLGGPKIVIDGAELPATRGSKDNVPQYWKSENGTWITKKPSKPLRRSTQMGGIEALLRSSAAFNIIYHGNQTFPVALGLSRNLLNYYYADSQIINGASGGSVYVGNRLSLSVGAEAPKYLCEGSFPIRICPASSSVQIRKRQGAIISLKADQTESEVGVIFLRPYPDAHDETLELVIWGSTPRMLAQAARLAPLMTGAGQPDFVILDRSAAWRGVDGAALGFFDASWEITDSSSLAFTSTSLG